MKKNIEIVLKLYCKIKYGFTELYSNATLGANNNNNILDILFIYKYYVFVTQFFYRINNLFEPR